MKSEPIPTGNEGESECDQKCDAVPNPKYAPVIIPVHNGRMKTRANINLDNDAYNFATAYASAKGIPLGAAVSELLRRAEQLPEPPSSRLTTDDHGFPVVARTGKIITPEMVKEGSEDELS